MAMKSWRGWIAGAALVLAAIAVPRAGFAAEDAQRATPEKRAVAWLVGEVPRWSQENGCYSCHNNGDATRALLSALTAGELADRKPLEDTLRFLARPEKWDSDGPEGPFKDKKLARIQFAAALAAAHDAHALAKPDALATAARLLAPLQTADGCWETEAAGTIGSPVTYGRALATALAASTLRMADAEKYRQPIAKAQTWFKTTEIASVLDASAALLALSGIDDAAARAARERAIELIRRGESPTDGWGPFVNSPPEVFDTALVVLAIKAQKERADLAPMIARGRNHLIATQSDDGSWPPTTRPPGADSYAQQVSTTGWATQALLVTRDKAKPRGK
jgi:hypothetical protein